MGQYQRSMFHMTFFVKLQNYNLSIYQKLHQSFCVQMENENKTGFDDFELLKKSWNGED